CTCAGTMVTRPASSAGSCCAGGAAAPSACPTGPDPVTADRYRGALVGLALGDALGAPYEFRSPPFAVDTAFATGVFGTPPGHPTDDSTLASFAAEAVLEPGGWEGGYIRRLVAWMQSGPPDIGNQTRRAAQSWAAGAAPEPDAAA